MSSYFGKMRLRKCFVGLIKGQSADGWTHQLLKHFDALINLKTHIRECCVDVMLLLQDSILFSLSEVKYS